MTSKSNLSSYRYKAYDKAGQLVSGVKAGKDIAEVKADLVNMGYMPIDVTPMTKVKSGGRVTTADLEELTSQLALLLKSGLKIDYALNVLVENASSETLQNVLKDIHQKVQQGHELWKAMSSYEKVFPELYREMVKIGESSGRLVEVFDKLAENLHFQRELKKKITQALVYPMFILLVCVVSLAAIFNFVVPSMSGLFESLKEIPVYTQILLDVSHWFQENQIYSLVVFVLLVFSIYKLNDQLWFVNLWTKVAYSLPIVKHAMVQVELVRYCASMELMLGSGIDLSKAMGMSSNSVRNAAIRGQLNKAHDDVSHGSSLFSSISGIPIFDSIALSLIKVGEETGQIGLVFGEVNRRARSKFESWMLKLTSMLEPLMIVVMGGIVGSVVVIMLLSIVSVNDVSF